MSGERQASWLRVFMPAAEALAGAVLTAQIEGDYDEAGRLILTYGKMTPEIERVIAKLSGIPAISTPATPQRGWWSSTCTETGIR